MPVKALNTFGRVVHIGEIGTRLEDPYWCRSCRSLLVVRWGKHVQCFAHPPHVNPGCRERVDEDPWDSEGGGDYSRILRQFGRRILQKLLETLAAAHKGHDLSDKRPTSELIAKALATTVALAVEEWHPENTFLRGRPDAANILAMLRLCECSNVLSEVIRTQIGYGFDTSNFEHLPKVIRRHVLATPWHELFGDAPVLLPDLWKRIEGRQTLTYIPQYGGFVRSAGSAYQQEDDGIVRDICYADNVTVRANWSAFGPSVKLVRFERRGSTSRVTMQVARSLGLGGEARVDAGDGLIVYNDQDGARSYLYVMPLSATTQTSAAATNVPSQANRRADDRPADAAPTGTQAGESDSNSPLGSAKALSPAANGSDGPKPAGREGKPTQASAGTRLYIGNLSFDTPEETIRALFARAGEVRELSLPTDRQTGKPRGFAFVTMGTIMDAEKAISDLNAHMVDGRQIRVNIAQERSPAAATRHPNRKERRR